MASTIYLKSKQSAGTPTAGVGFTLGEVAVNSNDGEIFVAQGPGGLVGDASTSVKSSLMKHGGTMTGSIDMDSNSISDVRNFNFDGEGTVNSIKDEDDMASDSSSKLATQQSIKAYVDAQVAAVKKIWTGNTFGTRCGVLNTWYISSLSLGTSIATADFVDDAFEKSYYPFFIAPHACTIESIGFAGGTNYANDYEIEFWHVNYDNNDTAADAATKIGSTISLSAPSTTAMLSSIETGLSVALAAGDCVFHVCRFTSGSTNKYLYINPTIGYK